MAKSSFGPNRAATWTVTQKPRPMPRIVRLGRPANDNYRRHDGSWMLRMLGLAAAALALVAVAARFI